MKMEGAPGRAAGSPPGSPHFYTARSRNPGEACRIGVAVLSLIEALDTQLAADAA